MSQRASGYERKERDLYETPEWVTRALLDNLDLSGKRVWEPARGGGKIAEVLRSYGLDVLETDIAGRDEDTPLMGDFLSSQYAPDDVGTVVTNPPYAMAEAFVQQALELMRANEGIVAMLLRVDWDSAATRAHLFGKCSLWRQKIVLTKRIVWFGGGASPSFNHAWFIWDWKHNGPPTIGYAP